MLSEPERRAARLRLEQELWRLIDQIPVPMAKRFLELINGLNFDMPGA